ncbi:MAG: sigma-54-dependent Fis family transcriptional regulator [Gammaproteobacteria bacterium]|nr:sigma-54-dependent Fis family transcriptional regulator [Gammaproteobacteria bacterium]
MNTNLKPSLLLVDDDPIIADTLGFLLRDDYEVTIAQSREETRAKLSMLARQPKLALVDLGLPPVPHTPDEGFALIPELLARDSKMKILVLSGQDRKANIQHALTLGAIDFIPKPCDAELLKSRLSHQLLLLDAEEGQVEKPVEVGMVGKSQVMTILNAQIHQFADAPFPILIEGESGTGKELIAQMLHDVSERADKPNFVINCAAFTKDLLEAQLFGHAKGAFTGAAKDKVGFFEESGDGILFLDEIGELPLELQAKLLRVLENGEFYRLGETKARISRARIIAATNKDMAEEVRAGRFRQDLYHRLSILTIKVPPLAQRGDDRFLLLEHFKQVYAGTVPPFSMDDSAISCWRRYTFPGNVRELRNLVIRLGTKYPGQTVGEAEVMAEMEMGEMAISPGTRQEESPRAVLEQILAEGFVLEEYLQEIERTYVTAALQHCNNNLSKAATLLNMNRTTLYSRLEKLGLR